MEEKVKKNCNSCKSSMFDMCDGLQNNEEYLKIKETVSLMEQMKLAHKFKSNFICDDYRSFYIEYPIEVSKINIENNRDSYKEEDIGKYVRVSPCGEKYNGQTFIGIYLGSLPVGHHITHNSETKELEIRHRNNSAMFVPEINKIIYGHESFWNILTNIEDFKEITKKDIENVWYLKALKSISSED